jgi:hypothetical protein
MSDKKSNKCYQEIQEMLVVYAEKANEWVRFSERDTELDAKSFVQTVVLGWLKKKDASLNELAHSAMDLGLKITGSALHERMGKQAVMLLASVLQQALDVLRKPCRVPLKLLEKFTGVYITDSTQISLPQSMYEIFRGNQDNSMLKLQVTWDYLSGNLAAIELEDGRHPDQKCQLHVSHAQAKTLQLFDLGYFKQEYLRDIDQQDAYFVSRYQSQTALYHLETQEAFDLIAWLQTLQANQAELHLRLGGRVKLPVRLLVRRLSQEATDARRRKAKQKARQQGKTCSAHYLALLAWDILVSNLDEHDWSLSQIFDLYPIRFQIEWLFRIWKSQLGLDVLGNWRVERILCQLYAHLLAAVLIQLLTANWRWHEFEYSLAKSVQIIQSAVKDLMRCLVRSGWGFSIWLQRLERDFRSFGCKTKRRKSPSTVQIIYNWGLS